MSNVDPPVTGHVYSYPGAAVVPCVVADLSFIPTPWIPSEGETFEGRLRGRDGWHRMRWLKWSASDPTHILVEVLEIGPRAYDTIVEMRPVSL